MAPMTMQQLPNTISASACAALLLLTQWVAPACAPARASEVESPDDTPGWLEITCRQGQDECAKKAKEILRRALRGCRERRPIL